MAQVANTVHAFQFAVEINGLTQFLVQTFEPPTLEVEVAEHGDTNFKVGTPGMVSAGDATLEKLRPADNADTWAFDWFNGGADPFTGSNALAGNIKRVVVVRELNATQNVALRSWIMEGCFVKSLTTSKYERTSSDNVIETVVLHVDRCRII